MKGIHGIIIAVVLGVLGAALNFFYLQSKSKGADTVAFLGVKPDVSIKQYEKLTADKLVKVEIPRRYAEAGNLTEFVYLYEDLETVKGYPATRNYQGGELLYREQIVVAPEELVLGPGERAFQVAVDQTFAHPLLNPGDIVEFRVPVFERNGNSGENVAPKLEEMGPFTIRAVDGRLGSVKASPGAANRQGQVKQVTIVVSETEYEQKAKPLLDMIGNGNRGVRIIRVGAEMKK